MMFTVVHIDGIWDDTKLVCVQFDNPEEAKEYIKVRINPVDYGELVVLKDTEVIKGPNSIKLDFGRIK